MPMNCLKKNENLFSPQSLGNIVYNSLLGGVAAGRGGFLERADEQTHPAAARHPSLEGIIYLLTQMNKTGVYYEKYVRT